MYILSWLSNFSLSTGCCCSMRDVSLVQTHTSTLETVTRVDVCLRFYMTHVPVDNTTHTHRQTYEHIPGKVVKV